MKAATIARYGSPGVIEVRDVPAPAPGPGDVLVRVHAATVNRTDCGELLHPTLDVQTGEKAGVVVIAVVTEGRP